MGKTGRAILEALIALERVSGSGKRIYSLCRVITRRGENIRQICVRRSRDEEVATRPMMFQSTQRWTGDGGLS
jgi:hypothetical protein